MHISKTVKLSAALATATLILSACGGPSTPPQPTEQAGLIKGQVTPWTASAVKTVQPEGYSEKANVLADGKFDLNLPNVATMTGAYAKELMGVPDFFGGTYNPTTQIGTCTDVSTNASDSVKMAGISKLFTESNRELTAGDSGKLDSTVRMWVFTNQDANFNYKGTCIGGTVNQTFNLKKGWNVFKVEYLIPEGNAYKTVYTPIAQPTTYTPWYLRDMYASQLATQKNMFEPWKNSAAYKANH